MTTRGYDEANTQQIAILLRDFALQIESRQQNAVIQVHNQMRETTPPGARAKTWERTGKQTVTVTIVDTLAKLC